MTLLDFDKQGIVLQKINNFVSIFSLWHSFPRPLGSDVLPGFLNNINYHIIWLRWMLQTFNKSRKVGLRILWWMIWCRLIFWPTTHLVPYWGIFSSWLRFADLHWFARSSLFTRYMSSWWYVFILSWLSSEAFLKSFSQTHIFLYFYDSLMKLSQAHRLSYHHFSRLHNRSLIHPHKVILKSLGQTDIPMLSKLWMV